MITIVLILLWVLLMVAVLIALYRRVYCSNVYEFKDYEKTEIPYVTVDIQGNPMNMVVDTGCAVSLLNIPSISNCELLYRKSNNQVTLSAVTSEGLNAGGILVDFVIGKKKVTEEFFLHDTEDFANFNRMHGIHLHGLLGCSFFEKNNCSVDFKKHRLIVK